MPDVPREFVRWTCPGCHKGYRLLRSAEPPARCPSCRQPTDVSAIANLLAREQVEQLGELEKPPVEVPAPPPMVFKPAAASPAEKEAAIAAAVETYTRAIGPQTMSEGSLLSHMFRAGGIMLLLIFGVALLGGLGRDFNWPLAAGVASLAVFSGLFGLLFSIYRRLGLVLDELRSQK